jgi:hypothetical protein
MNDMQRLINLCNDKEYTFAIRSVILEDRTVFEWRVGYHSVRYTPSWDVCIADMLEYVESL